MSSLCPEHTMNTLFRRTIPLMPAQNQRLADASVGVLLAGSSQLPKVARWLASTATIAGRVQFLRRLLDARFMTQELVYQPFLRHVLQGFSDPVWHVVIDRTVLHGYDTELLLIALAYHGHALPLVWMVIDFGCTSAEEQIALWQRVVPLIPPHCPVIAHGDTEFGSVHVMRFLQQQGWHFMLGQAANTRYCEWGSARWQLLRDLPVTPHRAMYLSNIAWTELHAYGPLNAFAFYDPHQNSPESPRRDIHYCATSLPITHPLRRLGRRRWGIECCFKGFKSAGWNLELSAIADFQRHDSLLILLSVAYLWTSCVGRWLCKTGKRRMIDHHPHRQLSLFRIGWDWLVSQFRLGNPCPAISTLYS